MNGMIFDIEHGSFVDGPGIRTTVFFKGCNLSCKWCHNPESQQFTGQLLFYSDKCTSCGKCREVCPHELLSCDLCGRCELYCPNDARKLCGTEMTADEILQELLKDKDFYTASGGGVTFSGGECMLQIEFLTELLRRCKENGIHTAVDTAGHVPWMNFEKILPYTDLFLYDVKCASEELHREWTGVSNQLILENLRRISELIAGERLHEAQFRGKLFIRVPVIGGVNDNEDEIRKIAEILKDIRYSKVELLPYHKMGEYKYGALGKDWEVFTVPDEDRMNGFRRIVSEH